MVEKLSKMYGYPEIKGNEGTPLEGTPLYEQKITSNEYREVTLPDGRIVVGTVLTIGNNYKSYFLFINENNEKELYLLDLKTGTGNSAKEIEETPNIVNEISEIVEKRHKILEARKIYVEELSKGDPLLKEVLTRSIEYGNGCLNKPITVDGIDFYEVGFNSSHEFFIGTKDGKKYIYSIGEYGWDKKTNQPIYKKHLDEVTNWDYVGHR